MAQAKTWGFPAAALIFGVLAGALGWKALNAPNAQIEMKFPSGGSLKIDAKQDLADPNAMFKKLFSTDLAKAGTMWLLKQQNIFSLDDSELLDAFLKNCPDRVQNESDEQRRQRWNDCFQRNRLFTELKARSETQRPPFQYLGTDVRVGTPSADRAKPVASHANVCTDRGFLGREILLVDPSSPPTSRRQLVTQATGYYPCPDTGDFPDIQLNEADAYHLFKRRTNKLEQAIAYITYR
jgi:hypothetical protein